MALIQFVQNFDDMSNNGGFQFKFFCDRCGNGYMSSFQTSKTNATEGILKIGDRLPRSRRGQPRKRWPEPDLGASQIHRRPRGAQAVTWRAS